MILIQDGERYDEFKFTLETVFKEMVIKNKEMIFGKDTIYKQGTVWGDPLKRYTLGTVKTAIFIKI